MRANKTNGGVLLKLGIVLAVLAGIAFAVLTSFQQTVRVKAAKRDNAVDAVTGSVVVDAEGGTNKELKAFADGVVEDSSAIAIGHKFKKGDVLLQLDTSEYKRLVAEYERKYADDKAQAHLRLTNGKPELLANVKDLSDEDRANLYRKVSLQREDAEEKLAQAKRLHELGDVSDQDLRNADRALEALDLQLQIDAVNERRAEKDYEVTMENHKLQLDRMQIRAPDDGEIIETSIWNGALISRGHVVGKWMSHGRVVSAKISEESFGRVRVGQKARVRFLTQGDQDFEAKVSKLLPNADEGQRFTIHLDVKNASSDQLLPNSTGEVTITVDQHPDATLVSRLALFDVDKICVVKDGRVEKRQVKVGYVNLTEAEILSGISPGEHVIVQEPQRFRDGDRVRIELIP